MMSSNDHCCIGFRRRRSSSISNDDLLGLQKKCSLAKQHDTVKLTTAELELVTRSQLSKNNDEDDDTVQFYNNDDALLLKCRPIFLDNDMQSIFGITEAVISAAPSSSSLNRDSVQANISWVEPIVADDDDDNELNQDSCSCVHPRGCWKRQQESSDSKLHQHTATPSSDHCEGHLKIIDLTKLQDMRRNDDEAAGYHHPSFDSAANIFHLLRSTLNCTFDDQLYELHSASPWKTNYDNSSLDGSSSVDNTNDARSQIEASQDQVVALLIKSPSNESTSNSTWYDELERQEYRELVDFRVGDAAPSHYLHSSMQLSSRNKFFEALHHHLRSSSTREESCSDGSNCLESGVSLFVYRKMSPRDMLNSPCHEGAVDYPGCLTETYLEEAVDDPTDCEVQLPIEPVLKYRMVSPPYLMHDREYPGLLDPILQRLDDIRREAKLIPHWTAWPERNHYSSSGSGENGGASWTVFPLCYTFPADDITQRKFIDKTCAFVPVTTALLEGLGPLLRTALFSRLDPKTKLGTHTGWSDLANHVLRVHIPLIVPRGDVCGTWVDGCVETQDVGRIICFDDSKVHRAFNYSESEERIVLIIDLKRPSNLPKGTAVGGHTDELDGFIRELSMN